MFCLIYLVIISRDFIILVLKTEQSHFEIAISVKPLFMRNFLFIFTSLILLSSCMKEELEIIYEKSTSIETKDLQSESINYTRLNSEEEVSVNTSFKSKSTEVTVITSSQSESEIIVQFDGDYNFSNAFIFGIQLLDFVDGNGKNSTLSFDVNGYQGANGSLDVTYAIGGNDLTGLDLKTSQSIVIVDEEIN